jgi:hypothetical protein
LNYSRAGNRNNSFYFAPDIACTCHIRILQFGGGRWIRTTEGVSQQIYSLPPLAAWVSLRSHRIEPTGAVKSNQGETARDFGLNPPRCQRAVAGNFKH